MINRTNQIQEMLEGFYKMKHRTNVKKVCRVHNLVVTHTQWVVLNFIDRENAVSVKEIRIEFGVTSSAVTQLVTELIKNSHVTKQENPADRRTTIIRLTPKTKTSLTRAKRAILAHMLHLFSVLNDKEFATYARLNRKINTKI